MWEAQAQAHRNLQICRNQSELGAQQNEHSQERQRDQSQLEPREDAQNRHTDQLQQRHEHQLGQQQSEHQLGQQLVQEQDRQQPRCQIQFIRQPSVREQDRQQPGCQIQLGVLSRSMSGQPGMPGGTSLGEKGSLWCDLTDNDAFDPLGNWWHTGDRGNSDRHVSAGHSGEVGSNDNAGGKKSKERADSDDNVGQHSGADRFVDASISEHARELAEDVDVNVGNDDIDVGTPFMRQRQQLRRQRQQQNRLHQLYLQQAPVQPQHQQRHFNHDITQPHIHMFFTSNDNSNTV